MEAAGNGGFLLFGVGADAATPLAGRAASRFNPPMRARLPGTLCYGLCPGLALAAAGALARPARAQVVIPHGDFDGGFETWLVAAVTFALLCLAVWRYVRGRD